MTNLTLFIHPSDGNRPTSSICVGFPFVSTVVDNSSAIHNAKKTAKQRK